MRKILLVGGSGHCMSILDSLYQLAQYDEIGIIDLPHNIGNAVLASKIIGSDNDIPRLYKQGFEYAFISLGSVISTAKRQGLYHTVVSCGMQSVNIIDKTSAVSEYAELHDSIFVGKNAVINAGAMIGTCAIINTGAIIEHGCKIGRFSHISVGAVLGGNVCVGNNTLIGLGARVIQGVHIGSNCIIGAGSVVTKDIGDNVKAYGVPCKVVEQL